MTDPGFPRGAWTLQGGGREHTILPNSPKNCMKLKEFGRRRGGVRPSRPPPLRSATALVPVACIAVASHQVRCVRVIGARFICTVCRVRIQWSLWGSYIYLITTILDTVEYFIAYAMYNLLLPLLSATLLVGYVRATAALVTAVITLYCTVQWLKYGSMTSLIGR